MGRIQLLDDQIINKIAAGEVVERPASVVKELLENSLDAGATRITVELVEGGRKRIVISDNGCGMDRDDAILALQRHATSKIQRDEDLFNLHTMGFRGEALASIAAVSKLTLMTCEQGKDTGVRVVCEGGTTPDISPWQSSGGTTIMVEDLFYNVPVRGKFLKAASTEYGNVLELMQALALAWPHVDLTLVHNGREQLRATAVVSPADINDTATRWSEEVLRKRCAQVLKKEDVNRMVLATASSQYGDLRGLVSAPGLEKATAREMYLFVNGRWVKDKALRFAVLRGYHSHLLRGKYPVVVAFLTMDPGIVDVNVHPAKTEVRLQYANELQGVVAMGIREALRKAEWAAPTPSSNTIECEQQAVSAPETEKADSVFFAPPPTFRKTWEFSGSTGRSAASGVASSKPSSSSPWSASDSSSHRTPSSASFDFDIAPSANPLFVDSAPLPARGEAAAEAVPWHDLQFIGSFADCYLMFSCGERSRNARLLVVDQHALHERIIYERLCQNQKLLESSQALLVPEALSFAPLEVTKLQGMIPLMERCGFKFSVLDQTTIEVHSVPVLLVRSDLEEVFGTFARHEESTVSLEGNAGIAHDLLATMACHSAVRAGEHLPENELNALLREAQGVDFFHNCPHGRRVFRWWDENQVARWFDR